MKKISIGNHLTHYLLGICVLLAGILALEIHNMVQIQDDTTPEAQPAVEQLTRDVFTAPRIATFSEIIERPLFSKDRTPPPEPKIIPAAAAKVLPLRLQLEGVAITPEAKIAVIRDLSNNKMLRLEKGMKHQGWDLISVTATGATFKRGEQSQVITLETEKNNRGR